MYIFQFIKSQRFHCGNRVNSAFPERFLLSCTDHHGKSDTLCLHHSTTHTAIPVKTWSCLCSFFISQKRTIYLSNISSTFVELIERSSDSFQRVKSESTPERLRDLLLFFTKSLQQILLWHWIYKIKLLCTPYNFKYSALHIYMCNHLFLKNQISKIH